MRGAYEVGVLLGVVETLEGAGLAREALFRLIAGTSVGAINATFLAANSHRRDHGLSDLANIWKGLHLGTHLRFRAGAFIRRMLSGVTPTSTRDHLGSSLVDAGPLEAMVRDSTDWEQLHENLEDDTIGALFIAALEIATGRTIIFGELSPKTHYPPTRDPRRTWRSGNITHSHVLASAAIPLLFPAQRIGKNFYCDGGLRFNTPIAPVIRAGANRIFVISTTYRTPDAVDAVTQAETIAQYPSATFLAGKILNALLLDPIDYDLQVLHRTNQLVKLLDRALTPDSRAAFDRVVAEERGTPYRRLETLVFAPSQDLGILAADFLRLNYDKLDLEFVARQAFKRVAKDATKRSADWLTYLVFDGRFAEKIIDLGRKDVHARAGEVIRFFRPQAQHASEPPPPLFPPHLGVSGSRPPNG
jgi:NTE family protein